MKKLDPKRFSVLAIAVALLAGCATGGSLTDEQRGEIHRIHAGEPVRSFHHFGTLHSWSPVDDSSIVVHTRPRTAYLLTLSGSCPGLQYARAISLGDQSGTVHAGFDNVTVLDRNAIDIPCRIEQIQPIDVDAVREAEKALRDQVSGGT